MERTKWMDRKFNFDFPPGLMRNIITRLEGTGLRLKNLVLSLSEDKLKYQPAGKWSIKEHIGHLINVESLHEGRIDDILEGKNELRAAFKKVPDSEKPDYNNKELEDLIHKFETKREHFISKLENLNDEVQNSSAFHARLEQKMRPVDIAYFAAEHDDHHLVSIRENLRK